MTIRLQVLDGQVAKIKVGLSLIVAINGGNFQIADWEFEKFGMQGFAQSELILTLAKPLDSVRALIHACL